MSKEEVLKELRINKVNIKNKFHAELLAIFGSYARGDQSKDSDLDILYRLSPGSNFGMVEIDSLEQFIKDIIGVPSVDLVNEKYINPIIEIEIKNELEYV